MDSLAQCHANKTAFGLRTIDPVTETQLNAIVAHQALQTFGTAARTVAHVLGSMLHQVKASLTDAAHALDDTLTPFPGMLVGKASFHLVQH